MSDFTYSTGKRKNAISRTRLYAGTGQITVNGRPFEDYFPRKTLQMIVQQPLKLVKMLDKYDIKANCSGGGVAGQAEACATASPAHSAKSTRNFAPFSSPPVS